MTASKEKKEREKSRDRYGRAIKLAAWLVGALVGIELLGG